MSRIIRQVRNAERVLIGELQHDPDLEGKAEATLGALFPAVAVTTAHNGTKQIPIEEVFKIEQLYQQEIQAAYQRGLKEGQQNGHERGLREGLAKAEQVLKQFDQAIKDAVGQRAALLEEAKHKVLDLVLQISRKVTFDAVQFDGAAVTDMIAGVISRLIDKTRIKIKVHPDHLPLVEQSLDRFLSDSAAIKELSVEADPRVRYGGCFIETPTGDIDARLESQFEVIEGVMKSGEEQT